MNIINSISIIFPFYNETRRINNCFKDIIKFKKKNNNIKLEFIFVDDGSTDDTSKKIKSFINNNKINSKIIKLNKNYGKGYALKTGVLKSNNSWILTSDVDISVSLNQINKWLVKKNIKSNYIYFGSRNLQNSIVSTKFHRKFIGYFFNKILKFLLKIDINDSQCGFKLYPRKYAKKLFSNLKDKKFAHDIEILLLAKKYKIKVIELPVKWVHKNDGKINLLKDSTNMLSTMIKLKKKFNL